MRRTRAAIALGVAVLLAAAAAHAQQLPPAPPPIPLLHRGANGGIEILDPETEMRLGHKLCDPIALCVGKGQTYPTLTAALAKAHEGDIIEVVAGVYRETAKIDKERVSVRGSIGRAHFDCAGLQPVDGAGCLVVAAKGVSFQDLEITGAEAPQGHAACIAVGETYGVEMRDVICHGSQSGLIVNGGTILIEQSEFYDNATGPDEHNVLFAGNCDATIRSSIFRDSKHGDELTSRCARTEIDDSTFRSTSGERDIDIPDGGDTMIYNTTLEKDEGSHGLDIVAFTREACLHPGSMMLKDVHIVNAREQAEIHNYDRCANQPIAFDGVVVEGTQIERMGYVLGQ